MNRAMVIVGWLAAAVLATVIGLAGIRMVGDSLTGTPGGVLGQDEVAKALASPAPATVDPGPTGPGSLQSGTLGPSSSATSSASPQTSAPTPSGAPPDTQATSQQSFTVPGGTVVVGCRNGQAYLISWSPAPGYRTERAQNGGEGGRVEVRFDAGHGNRSQVRARCAANVPVAVDE